jgi:hypothetical protein
MVLAISSVQTFIQRCLLNLEKEVHPTAINAEQWKWMKRYRVWEANRKIFLFPENWLEPEFRDDKTYLFRELEGKLLQSDITNDLAEDAFFDYLKSLEMLARLEIVAMYCDEQPNPADNVLHVIGRTHNLPHKYFYRTISNQMWTPWVPVTVDIEGDHVVAVIWKQRLHLFWATFMVKAKKDAATTGSNESYKQRGDENVASPPLEVDVQLNWSEYFQGKWTPRQASGFGNPSDIGDPSTFKQSDAYIYVTKEYITEDDGTVVDGAVNIHLTPPVSRTFRLMSKNSQPQVNLWYSSLPYEPYSYNGVNATEYIDGSPDTGALDIGYTQSIEVSYTNTFPKTVSVNKAILQQGSDYALLFASNPPQFTFSEERTKGMDWLGWYDSPYLIDILTRPFFYQDSQNTFFVEPTMTETRIDEWEWWTIQYPWPYAHLNSDYWWNKLTMQAAVPTVLHLPPISQIDPSSLYQLKPTQDWATNPATVLPYEGQFVGKGGGLTLINPTIQNGLPGTGGQLKPVVPGGSLGSIATIANGHVFNGGTIGSILHTGGVNLINQGGLTRGTLANLQGEQQLNRTRFASGNVNVP